MNSDICIQGLAIIPITIIVFWMKWFGGLARVPCITNKENTLQMQVVWFNSKYRYGVSQIVQLSRYQ